MSITLMKTHMKKSVLILIIAICTQFTAWSQEQINAYKYVLIPNQFEFLSAKDQYQINSLTKFLFNKYGYTAFLEDEELPEDLKRDRCLALKADVNKVSGGFLKTKLQMSLLDCNNKVVAASKVGETREKKYEVAYNLALREAFETFQNFDYAYQPTSDSNSKMDDTKADVAAIKDQKAAKKEIERLKNEVESLKNKEREAVSQVEKQVIKAESKTEVMPSAPKNTIVEDTADLLYAQPLDNGYQIVDTEPKKVMILLNTGVQNTFLVKGKDAIVYKRGNTWVYESYETEKLETKTLNLKF
ncbi:hypothetical protein ESY86_14770 [Subsaximicrobium wynnwilliamsii]|uniref:Secreted protein n=1 Tax=Subsaximicrobium wynnwilliamsii TaxID=291179 RepID=A0A5C6ZH07_9FLAO|nr:hypothetical protein [Subsaximicrobium wynnwilliamsii]TXD82291.1 hypothetical protein ESY87_14360 [Subsaximicrobium wynnwilliamsii]TXD87929.1 hypothetical protein ESY86_14770 [Subsaximicrobium wynnwilliamsii]TXE01922.1 hypothetical protein ESY88_13935 [Subsaximicrobium wynnwilliamsii]